CRDAEGLLVSAIRNGGGHFHVRRQVERRVKLHGADVKVVGTWPLEAIEKVAECRKFQRQEAHLLHALARVSRRLYGHERLGLRRRERGDRRGRRQLVTGGG